jgi:hypothetical protein
MLTLKSILCGWCMPRSRRLFREPDEDDIGTTIVYTQGTGGDEIIVKKKPVKPSKNVLTFAVMTVACTPNNSFMSPALTGPALGNIEMLFGPIKFVGLPRIDMVNRRAYYLFSGQERTIDEWSEVKRRANIFESTLEHLWTLQMVDILDAKDGPYAGLEDNRINQSLYAEYIVSSEEARRALYEVPAYDERGRLRPVAKVAVKKEPVVPLEVVAIDEDDKCEEIDLNVDDDDGDDK